jgi:hypothetical protein
LFTVLNGRQKGTLGKIKGLFKQPDTAEKLDTCKQELGRIVELFKVYKMNCMSTHIQFIAGTSYRFNLVSNGANAKGCKGPA